MMDAPPTAERERFARLVDRYARFWAISAVPIVVIALADLATASPLDDRWLDIGLLAAAAFGLLGAAWLRRVVRGLRSGELPRAASPVRWGRNVIGIIAVVGVNAGIGYLFGGPLGGIALPLATVLLGGISAWLGLRMRRRLRMSDDVGGHS